MKDQKEIAAVQVADTEMDQIAGEAGVIQVLAEDQGLAMIVQTVGEEVRTVHQMAGGVATLQDVQVAGHLHEARLVVIAVEAGASVHLQAIAVVLPEMEGEQVKRKVVLLQAAGEILVNPERKIELRLYFSYLSIFKKYFMATKTATSAPGHTNGQKREGLLEKFFLDQLKDIYYAEQQMLKALKEMKAASTTEELEDAFENHHMQTEKQIKRLDKVFQILKEKPEGKRCEAMDGLIKEAKTIINETKEGTMTRDAALIIAAQKVEHYEIATYGGLVQLALTLGKHRAAALLDKTLLEEEQTDHNLTYIAEAHINFEAEEEDEKTEKSMESSSASASSSYN